MPAVCLYFEVHQPYRIRSYDVFQVGRNHDYFDEKLNREIMQKVARKCYLPANAAMLRLIQRHEGRFRIAFSLTGVALEQMKAYAPEVIESFQELVATGCVELLSETYYHSLASLYCARPGPGSAWPRSDAEPLASAGDALEFRAQVAQHKRLMEELFGVTPQVFCNTELIYDDQIGSELAALGYKGVLAEGADDILDWRSPNYVYRAPGSELGLLLKNYKLSDDVAFRFSNRAWSEFPLSAEKYARWLHALRGEADTINLFMDYETFGEHQWAETGIFGFLQRLPAAVLAEPDFAFHTPSEVLARVAPVAELSFPRTVSWADSERDLSAWTGNEMQTRALARIYALGERIKRRNNPALLNLWRKLTSSDHFYYMCTKWFADGDVHAYFSPYESPYEAFINYMNAVSDLEEFVLGKPTANRAEAVLPAAE